MKKAILFSLLIIFGNVLFAQNKEEVDKLITEGVAFHDKGDYNSAIEKYDLALETDKDNLTALAEKAFSLFALKKFDESISCCKKAIRSHPKDNGLKTVYVTYGNALDAIHQTKKSIEVYNDGIKQFPHYYQLYFNKGITLLGAQKYDEALLSLQNSVMINPNHVGSHNAIARILYFQKNNIPSLLAFCRFLVIESKGSRATDNFQIVQKIMKGNVTQTEGKSVTINLNSDMFGDSKSKQKKENDFSLAELSLSMSAALDYDEKNIKKSEIEQFIRKFESICDVLKETRLNNTGFYWEYYVPYFTEMKEKNFTETFAYILFALLEDAKISDWLNTHKEEIDKFYDWSGLFKWKGI